MGDLIRALFLILLFGLLSANGCASTEQVASAQKDITVETDDEQQITAEDYVRASRFLSFHLNRKVYRSSVQPNWTDDDQFWYRVNIPEGHKFYRVNPSLEEKMPAFDHERLADVLSDELHNRIRAFHLPFSTFEYHDGFASIQFEINGKRWRCDIEVYICAEAEHQPRRISDSVDSPDGRYTAFIRDYNLWVYDQHNQEEVQLTTDGEKYYGYATNSQGWTRGDNPILLWSPDSRRIATFQQDEREVEKMPLIRTQTGRPGLEIWPYALPGDTEVPMLERVVIDVDTRNVIRLDVEPSHQRTSNCCGLTRGGNWADVEWSESGDHLAFVVTSRDYSTVTLYTANPVNGEVVEVYSERDEPFFESHLSSRGVPNWRVLHESSEFIWFTRADNWGHLYLHNLDTGERKYRITEGEWNVIDLVRVDEENRHILFTAAGKEEGRDPYYNHLYRIYFNGSGPELLTVENGNHQVSVSPSGSYFTTTWSQPQNAPVSVLKDVSGQTRMELEEADISEIDELGFRPPEPFSVKARDGITDIYGLMYKPSDFDPEKRYPIVNSIYPGPQAGSVVTRSFTTSRRGQAHALAELGFIVVQVDAFGTPYRSKDFHTFWYGDMADNGLEDQVSAMEQLAEEYEWIDLERAGMYGHSGGGFATAAAMFRFPDFFKVGVASAGNHDNRGYTYYWSEKYQGLLEDLDDDDKDTYTNQAIQLKAENLEGQLLISYGTMDSNVHPNMTLQVIDELIRHNKDFDVMVYPNRSHGYSNEPYNLRITWDYFVRHLLGLQPPEGVEVR